MTTNYIISKNGFTVVDLKTQHILKIDYDGNQYCGIVVMPEQSETLPLSAWSKGKNPFTDDNCFKGVQYEWNDHSGWWFTIRPTIPFSRIMEEVERLNDEPIGFHTISQQADPKLEDFVAKTDGSSWVFARISNDLGIFCENIMKGSKNVQMSYAYARRSASICLYLQGLFTYDDYEYVQSIFKAHQAQTGHSVAFQK